MTEIQKAIAYFKNPFLNECKHEDHDLAVKCAIEALEKQQKDKCIEKLAQERDFWKREALKQAAESGERKIAESLNNLIGETISSGKASINQIRKTMGYPELKLAAESGEIILSILIISEHMERANRVLQAVYMKEENARIPSSVRHEVITENAIYKAVIADKKKLDGYKADQIILDFAFYHELKDIVQGILIGSCVPKEFQIIDDRTLLL